MPPTLARVTNGAQLFDLLAASQQYRTDFDDFENEDAAELIGGIFQELEDIGYEIAEEGDANRKDLESNLDDILAELKDSGYSLYGGKGPEQPTDGQRKQSAIVVLEVKNAGGADSISMERGD